MQNPPKPLDGLDWRILDQLQRDGSATAAESVVAEIEAMGAVVATHGADALKGATAYITLEPCSTVGRTPV